MGVAAVVLLLAVGCSSSGDAESTGATTTGSEPSSTSSETPDATTTSSAPTTTVVTTTTAITFESTVTGPIESANPMVQPQPALAVPEGYVEEEFFIGGDATSFELGSEPRADGFWEASPADTAPYQTRVIVRRPSDAAFSGVVLVEWLNVTAIEASPDWAYLSEVIANDGHAYVAVSTQALGVVGGDSLLAIEIDDEAAADAGAEATETSGGGLVNADPDRYGSLVHPGDAFAYDIFSQVGAALRASPELLGGLEATTVIAAGESQSAGFLTTYLNAVHPLATTYDAFLVHSRGAGAAPIGGGFGEGTSFVDDGVLIRTDLDQPVFILEAETDLTLLGYSLARQPDTDLIRTWEVAGTAHADSHTFRAIIGGDRDPSLGSLIGCEGLINSGPHHEAVQAALHHLVVWAQDGPAPPTGPRLELTDTDPIAIARDERGIALGGVRNPLVDVPVVVATGDPLRSVEEVAAGFEICDLFGQTIPLDQAALVELHGSADEYVEAFATATAVAVDGGFLLPTDAEQLREEAEANRALFES